MIKTIAHLAFNVSDMDAALKFYCDGLGFRHIYTMTNADVLRFFQENPTLVSPTMPKRVLEYVTSMGDKPWHSYLQIAPRQYLELFYVYNNEQVFPDLSPYCCYQHLSLEVDDIQAAYDEVQRRGIKPTRDISMGPDFTKQFWIADPDGNLIELMEYSDKSWQITRAVL